MANPLLENTLISIRVTTKKRLEKDFGANYHKNGVTFDQVINEALDSHQKLIDVQKNAVNEMLNNEINKNGNGNNLKNKNNGNGNGVGNHV